MNQKQLAKFERIEREITEFAEGNPRSFEVLIDDGIYFNFDCPFWDDLREPMIPVAVGIMPESPHNEGEPTEPQFIEYSEVTDDLACQLENSFYNAGSRNEEVVFEYSPTNSHPEKGHYVFLGDIHNPRVAIRSADGKVPVNEGYI